MILTNKEPVYQEQPDKTNDATPATGVPPGTQICDWCGGEGGCDVPSGWIDCDECDGWGFVDC